MWFNAAQQDQAVDRLAELNSLHEGRLKMLRQLSDIQVGTYSNVVFYLVTYFLIVVINVYWCSLTLLSEGYTTFRIWFTILHAFLTEYNEECEVHFIFTIISFIARLDRKIKIGSIRAAGFIWETTGCKLVGSCINAWICHLLCGFSFWC